MRAHRQCPTVIFLSAGASRSDGAPLQGEVFREYFLCRRGAAGLHAWDEDIRTFFQDFYGIDVRSRKAVQRALFPTFEEVLGTIEIAGSQNESFRNWDGSDGVNGQHGPRLQHLHVFAGPAMPFNQAFPEVEDLALTVMEERMPDAELVGTWTFTKQDLRTAVNCSNTSCCNGGFNISRFVQEAVRSRKTEAEETSKCAGYEGSAGGRVKRREWLHRFTAKVQIAYKP